MLRQTVNFKCFSFFFIDGFIMFGYNMIVENNKYYIFNNSICIMHIQYAYKIKSKVDER